MKIQEVRKKYPYYKISYLPKKAYEEGRKSKYKIRITNDYKYDEVYIAKDVNNKYYLLYPHENFFTGSFECRQKAINWFKNCGR